MPINEERYQEYRQALNQQLQGLARSEGVDALQKRIAPISQKAAYYSGTIAQTGVKAHTRALKSEKARIAGVYMYEYVGLLRSTTRPFCRAMLGSTHHLSDIRQMSNGNRDPVLTYCGGWNCIHDLEPDPFAEHEQGKELREINDYDQSMRIPQGGAYTKRFHRALSERHFRNLNDQEAFMERCRNVELTRDRLQHAKDSPGNDLTSVDEARNAVERVTSDPDRRYFEFHRSESKAVFERDGQFVFASPTELKTLLDPPSYEQYIEDQVQYFVPVD